MPVPLNNSGPASTSSSNMNYIRHQGLMNSSSNAKSVTNTTGTTVSATGFSKLRSAFIRSNAVDETLATTTTTTTSKSAFNSVSSLKNTENNTNKHKLLSSTSKSVVSSLTEAFLNNASNNNNNNNSNQTNSTKILKRSKTESVSSSITNSDDECLNEKQNSATASTISSLSSDGQAEPETETMEHLLLMNQTKTLSETSTTSSSSIKLKSEQNQTRSNSPASSASPSCNSPTNKNSQMPFKIRSSKYRHVYGNPHKEDVCYKNIKITKNAAHDSAFCAVNPKFVAIVTEECGGGAFVVIPIKQTGRIDINMPKVTGHRGPVLDLKWNPFNDNEIASCSEDSTIKVWQIPDTGLYENLNEWMVDLHGHQRKVGQIEWHPTAENVMISSGADFQVIIWNLEKAEPIRIITSHNDTIQSMSWNRDGSFFATTCKDKKIRIFDPRSGEVVAEGDGHQGSKISKVIILGCGTKLFTTGFSRLSERQIALWNIKDLSKPIQMDVVDCSSGILVPYYDYDTKIVFVAGKGDGNIRYYEITDSEPYIHYLSEYKSATPQRGLGWMPKRGLDVTKNEVFRFYKLHATGGICEPISMIVPRKSEVFQEDIYPDTVSGIPSLSCEEWLAGENRGPILVSMKDGAIPFMPKIVTYKQLGFSDLGTNYSRSKLAPANNSSNKTNYINNTNKLNELSQPIASKSSFHALTNPKSIEHLADSAQTDKTPLSTISANDSQNTSAPNTKLISSSKSAFNKMSSSSSYSSSPPSSPSQSRKYIRMNSDNAQNDDINYSDGVQIKSNQLTRVTSEENNTNHASSSESVNQEEDFAQRKQSEEIEAAYITNCSKNPITLRKTESLRIESVQTIRNRFDRVNSNTIGPLTRNSQIASKNLTQINDYLNSSYENMNNNGEAPTQVPCSPPTLLLSPQVSQNTNKQTTPIPLLLNSSSTNTSLNQTPNNNNLNISNSSSCIKKRVWTPVQSSSNLSNTKSLDSNGTPNNPNDLQKSYFRLLEERNSLKEKNKKLEEEISAKDKRIQFLEDKLKYLALTDSNRIELAFEASDC